MKDWIYLDLGKYLYISITNPKKTLNKIKNIFKPLKCYFKFKIDKYAPYPVFWVSKPSFIHIISHDVGWKDKYDTPRFEVVPYVWIHIYKFNFVWYWDLNFEGHSEDYWEQALWYLYYFDNTSYGCDSPNIEKAKESWPWENPFTNVSTWNNEFLKNGQSIFYI